MRLFRRKTSKEAPQAQLPGEGVKAFLRGQNLEQVGKIDEAIAAYEEAVGGSFDAAGPYDRLLFIYEAQGRHQDVIRIAEASISAVRTYPAKQDWYRQHIDRAEAALDSLPRPR